MSKSLLLLAAGGLLLYGLTRTKTNLSQGTTQGGINALIEATQNPSVVVKPATVEVTATLPGVAGFNNITTSEVPLNVFQITEDVRIEGVTAPMANIPEGALISANELAWIDTRAQDEARQEAAQTAQLAVAQQEAAYYAANTTEVREAAAAAVPADSGVWGVWNWLVRESNVGAPELLNEDLYARFLRDFSGVNPKVLMDYASSINGAMALRNWISSHAVAHLGLTGQTWTWR